MSPEVIPERIEPDFRAKIWGSQHIGPWFEPRGVERIGEVWFPAGDLLIKFLFTSEKLSVQVHPDDDYAAAHENSRGKTEMWHILRADPGARIALGFKHPISRDRLIPSAESGEIMNLLNWIEVQAGETYFVPPGTVHAIGSGLALCEIQQNSDVTYRLFDYGRKRELHLQAAQEVAFPGRHPGKSIPRDSGDGLQMLVECPYFTTYRAVIAQPGRFGSQLGVRVVVVLDGSGRIDGLEASPGNVFQGGSHEWLAEPNESGVDMKLLLIA